MPHPNSAVQSLFPFKLIPAALGLAALAGCSSELPSREPLPAVKAVQQSVAPRLVVAQPSSAAPLTLADMPPVLVRTPRPNPQIVMAAVQPVVAVEEAPVQAPMNPIQPAQIVQQSVTPSGTPSVASTVYGVSFVTLAPLPTIESAFGHGVLVLSRTHPGSETPSEHVAINFGVVDFSSSLVSGNGALQAIEQVLRAEVVAHITLTTYTGTLESHFQSGRGFEVTPFRISSDSAQALIHRVSHHFSIPQDQDFFSESVLAQAPETNRSYRYHPYNHNCVTGIVDLLLEDGATQDAWEADRAAWARAAAMPALAAESRRTVIEATLDHTASRLHGFGLVTPSEWANFNRTGPQELRMLLRLVGVPASGIFANAAQLHTTLELLRDVLHDQADPVLGSPTQFGGLSSAFDSYFFDPSFDETGLTVRQTLIVPERFRDFIRQMAPSILL